jgi:hypothetical protein
MEVRHTTVVASMHVQIELVALIFVVMVVIVTAFWNYDAAAQCGSQTYRHQHKYKNFLHTICRLVFLKPHYLQRELPMRLGVTKGVL